MTQLFGIPLDTLTTILLVITLVIIGAVVLLAISNAIFFKIGVRNIPRRRTQMVLIVFALMLSTTLLTSVLATGDVINAAVQTVAVSNLGTVDETITGGQPPLGFFDDYIYFHLRRLVHNDPNIAAIGAALTENNLLIADLSSRQVRSKVTAMALIPGSEQGFGGIQADSGKEHYKIADLQPNEVYVNHTLAVLINARAGDTLYLYSNRWSGKRYQVHVRAIIADGGLIGELPYILSQAQTFRAIEHRHDDITHIFVATVYDLISSLIGLLIGLGIGAILFLILGPILARFNFPLKLVIQPRSLVTAYCLGVIFTFCSVGVSAWAVSRMTVVDALRNLPESGRPTASLSELFLHLLQLLRRIGATRNVRRILFEQVPDTLLDVIRTLARLGILPLLAGYWLLQFGLKSTQITPFSLGLSLIVIGAGLLLKAAVEWVLTRLGLSVWKRVVQRIFAAVVGLSILAYWALPFDVLASLGLPRFQGGVEVFFVAGMMMVLGAAWALLANAELLIGPLLALCSWLPGLQIMTRLASSYPLHHRFRTGLSVVMFSLVVFAMTVMAIITNAMQNNYTDINFQTGGYNIQAVAYFKPIADIRAALSSHGINPNDFSAIGTQSSTAVGVIQPNAQAPAWHLYPAQVVSGGFLQGYGPHLTGRDMGFNRAKSLW